MSSRATKNKRQSKNRAAGFVPCRPGPRKTRRRREKGLTGSKICIMSSRAMSMLEPGASQKRVDAACSMPAAMRARTAANQICEQRATQAG
eukprot:1156119-Pelagomonas_calceolata.AAC.16